MANVEDNSWMTLSVLQDYQKNINQLTNRFPISSNSYGKNFILQTGKHGTVKPQGEGKATIFYVDNL